MCLFIFQENTKYKEVSNEGMFSDNSEDGKESVSCHAIVNNIATVFKGVQNDASELLR